MKTNIGVEQELIMTKCDTDGVKKGMQNVKDWPGELWNGTWGQLKIQQ